MGFSAITLIYVVILTLVDARSGVLNLAPLIFEGLPMLISLSFLSYFARYLRWFWLLNRGGHRFNFFYGFLAYLSGFAFTATPGKLGELVRIRYFSVFSVPTWRTFSAFLYERAFDLLVVLLISSFFLMSSEGFIFALFFVFLVFFSLFLAFCFSGKIKRIAAFFRRHRYFNLARFFVLLVNGLSGCRIWLNFLDVFIVVSIGFFAWGVTALTFVLLLQGVEVSIDFFSALGIYPLAMLVGAASMLPGGVGTTEASIIMLLSGFSVPLDVAVFSAVGIRLITISFSMICGFISIFILELRFSELIPTVSFK